MYPYGSPTHITQANICIHQTFSFDGDHQTFAFACDYQTFACGLRYRHTNMRIRMQWYAFAKKPGCDVHILETRVTCWI